jgi:hypothetical protein
MNADEAIQRVTECAKINPSQRVNLDKDAALTLVAEIERLRQLTEALASPEKLSLEWEQGKSPVLKIKHWAASILAESFWQSFKEEGGQNFVILELNIPPDAMKLLVTIKRADGLTPEEMYGKARAETHRLRDENATFRDELLRVQAVVGDTDFRLINDVLGIENLEEDDDSRQSD